MRFILPAEKEKLRSIGMPWDIFSAQKVNFVPHHILTPDSTLHPILSYLLPRILAQEIV